MAAYQAFDVTKKVLITGAAGFIGFHLAKRLLEMGAVVLGFDNMNDYYDVSLKEKRLGVLRAFSNFSFIKGDLADEQAVTTAFKSFQPDIVVNLAAQAGVRYSLDTRGRILIRTSSASLIYWKHAVSIPCSICCLLPARLYTAIRKKRPFRRRTT